jgi:hypothetical protein
MILAFARDLISTDRSPAAGSAVRFGFSQRLLTTARETKKAERKNKKGAAQPGLQMFHLLCRRGPESDLPGASAGFPAQLAAQ